MHNQQSKNQIRQLCVALFDLDHTIISGDCSAHWLNFMLRRNWRRKLLIICLLPLVRWGEKKGWPLDKRNSIYLWAATVGISKFRLLALRRDAARFLIEEKGIYAYKEAMAAINEHLNKNEHIVIVTGALRWLARDICKQLQIPFNQILGSNDQLQWGGRVSRQFCFSENKVTAIKSYFGHREIHYLVGYSDSAADIPMLSICTKKVLVNPKPDCLHKFKQKFGNNVSVVQWSDIS